MVLKWSLLVLFLLIPLSFGCKSMLVVKLTDLFSGWSSVMETVLVVFGLCTSAFLVCLAGVFLDYFFVEKVVLV